MEIFIEGIYFDRIGKYTVIRYFPGSYMRRDHFFLGFGIFGFFQFGIDTWSYLSVRQERDQEKSKKHNILQAGITNDT
jgi:hypothetical protein